MAERTIVDAQVIPVQRQSALRITVPSRARQAVVVIGLMAAFYAMSALIGLGLTVLTFIFVATMALPLAVLSFAGAFVILWSIFPRIDRFIAPGPRLELAKHPQIYEVISEVQQPRTSQCPMLST